MGKIKVENVKVYKDKNKVIRVCSAEINGIQHYATKSNYLRNNYYFYFSDKTIDSQEKSGIKLLINNEIYTETKSEFVSVCKDEENFTSVLVSILEYVQR